jgi:hypothetical protein
MNEPKKIWHYTIGKHLPKIIESKLIKLATIGVREKPAVWFSTNPIWEQTCNKLWQDSITGKLRQLSKEETHRYGNGLVRIRIKPEAAPYNFQAFKRISKISNNAAKRLTEKAELWGAKPQEWWVSFESVPQSEWLDIEVWDGMNWNSMLEIEK